MDKSVVIGNLTTIIKIVICTVAPMITVYYGVDENTVIAFLVAVVGLFFGLFDARFPNTIFNNNDEPLKEDCCDGC